MHDHDLLKKITSITCEYGTKMNSFTLFFHFEDNKYIQNNVLSKTYIALRNNECNDLSINANGTQIIWKDDNDLTKEYSLFFGSITKKSFFNFFKDFDGSINVLYTKIGHHIRDKVIPNVMQVYIDYMELNIVSSDTVTSNTVETQIQSLAPMEFLQSNTNPRDWKPNPRDWNLYRREQGQNDRREQQLYDEKVSVDMI